MDEEETKEMPITVAESHKEVAVSTKAVPTSTAKMIIIVKPVIKREEQDKVLLSTMVQKGTQ